MMQLREQIRKLLDRGYSLPFTGREPLHIHQLSSQLQALSYATAAHCDKL